MHQPRSLHYPTSPSLTLADQRQIKIIEQLGAFSGEMPLVKGFSALIWKWNMMQLSFKEKVKLTGCHEQTGELAGAEEAFLGKNDFPKIQVGVNSSLSEREDDSLWQHRERW